MELPRPETEFFAEDEFIRCLEVDVPGEVISHDVLANMIRSRLYKSIFIIDSRFPYENKGGHVREINGFLYVFNIIDKNQLIKFYHKFKKKGECIAVVFHCELSSKRGRDVIRLFRNYDREQNQHPHVSFPNIFLLQDGFKAFTRTTKICALAITFQ